MECSSKGVVLYLALEVGSTKWTVAFATSPAQRPRLRTVRAGDRAALSHEVATAKMRLGLPADAPVVSCYEAGRDGFWLHRWLGTQGIQNLVVDSSSIEVKRQARRAKTDRLDAQKLVHLLMRWAGGERKVWSVVHVPTPVDEDARQLTREIATVQQDRTRLRNRMLGLLATQGLRLALDARLDATLATAQTGDGQPFPAALRARLRREWAQVVIVEERLRALAAQRDEAIAAAQTRVTEVARRLQQLKGIAETSSAVFSAELFGTRTFTNGRQLGALTGLVPVPYRSDQRIADQGISKRGRAELRRIGIQIAWGWVRWQPESALTRWFTRRFAAAGGRARRIGIVAVARKLLIALWHYVEHGVIPEGAVLKPVSH
jgi:transposase